MAKRFKSYAKRKALVPAPKTRYNLRYRSKAGKLLSVDLGRTHPKKGSKQGALIRQSKKSKHWRYVEKKMKSRFARLRK